MSKTNQTTEAELTVWYQSLQAGDADAASKLFEHCFPRLLGHARRKLPSHLRRVLDEEDVALSAFESFCRGAQRGTLGDIENRDELWRLLICITARKGLAHVRHELRQKRGGGKVRGESIFTKGDGSPAGMDQVSGGDLSPETLAQFDDQCRHLLQALGDETLQTIALLRLEGYSVAEIASRLDCAKRSVERRLSLIRKTWQTTEEEEHGTSSTEDDR